MIDKTYLECN